MLRIENEKSVGFRYSEVIEHCPLAPFRFVRGIEAVQVLKAIQCYRYQSCEHPGWENSDARRWIDRLESDAIANLPGYDDADWEIDQWQPAAKGN